MRLTYDAFISKLIQEVPSLKAILDEHLEDYDVLLAHVFMADVFRYIVSIYKSRGENNEITKVFSLINEAFSTKDTALQELVSVSFLELFESRESYYKYFQLLCDFEVREQLSKYSAH